MLKLFFFLISTEEQQCLTVWETGTQNASITGMTPEVCYRQESKGVPHALLIKLFRFHFNLQTCQTTVLIDALLVIFFKNILLSRGITGDQSCEKDQQHQSVNGGRVNRGSWRKQKEKKMPLMNNKFSLLSVWCRGARRT